MERSIAIDVEGSNESATEDPSVGGSGSRACAVLNEKILFFHNNNSAFISVYCFPKGKVPKMK